jgi:hypothetical protein
MFHIEKGCKMSIRDLIRITPHEKKDFRLSTLVFCLMIAAVLIAVGLAAQETAVANGLPNIDSIDPEFGGIGEKVTITGTLFLDTKGDSFVRFGTVKATEYVSWSDTHIEVVVPRGLSAGEVDVTVTVAGSGTSNPEPFTVVPYGVGFAEGYISLDFFEFLCLGNPHDCPVQVEVVYLFPDSTYIDRNLTVPAESRLTLVVSSDVGFDKEVSALIFSDLEVVAERPMYFEYNGVWSGGHDEMGTPYISKLWFFAEGYTGTGFDEWICVLNPNEATANLNFYFQTQEAGEIIRSGSVPPASRRSFKVNDLLGSDYQCSLVLESDQMVIAERSMYFDYLGMGNHHWQGGHCVMGVTHLTREYYFAEGTTRPGFEEWITLQNPFNTPITVIATYQLGVGQGPPIMESYVVPPESRETIYVPDEVGPDKDVSVKLASSSDFLAERPMYFHYTGYGASWEGGHCVMGAKELSMESFFAEGYTGEGFQEWLCLQNPGDQNSVVDITYLTQSGSPIMKTVTVPAKSRKTLYVNEEAGSDLELSCTIKVKSGPAILVERPMYFEIIGMDGGHDVVGYQPFSYQGSSALSGAGLQQLAPVGSIVFDHEGWRER